MDTKFNVVLVADRLYTDDINTEFDASDLEKISDEYYYGLYEELKKVCGGTVFHYQSPKDLADNAYKHKDDIVFTIYGGEKSRNRMALVPAVCESYGLKYVGADAYARIICQDKYLSKIYCERFGLRTAPSFLLEDEQDIQLMKDLIFSFGIEAEHGRQFYWHHGRLYCLQHGASKLTCSSSFQGS